MREWGSTLFHNDTMAFYLATVPAGTKLYRGTHSPKPTTGMEWLSFEMEQFLPLIPMQSKAARASSIVQEIC